MNQWRALLKEDDDQAKQEPGRRCIYKLWPDFKVKALIDRSIATVKADAAFKSYSATGSGIAWAVIDSGIDGTHPHFGTREDPENSAIYHPEVAELHYDFVDDGQEAAVPVSEATVAPLTPDDREAREQARLTRARQAALCDDLGHGTHVAGIIGGRLPANAKRMNASDEPGGLRYAVFEQVFEADSRASESGGSCRSSGRCGIRRRCTALPPTVCSSASRSGSSRRWSRE